MHSLDVLHSLTSDREILSTVMGLKIEFDSIPHQHYIPLNKRSAAEEVIVAGEIDKLLTKHVIKPVEHSSGEIISDIFLRDKKDETHRMILNLKALNQYAVKIHFKMDRIHTISKLIEKDCFMASVDLKDAYYSVPIAKSHRKYLYI